MPKRGGGVAAPKEAAAVDPDKDGEDDRAALLDAQEESMRNAFLDRTKRTTAAKATRLEGNVLCFQKRVGHYC